MDLILSIAVLVFVAVGLAAVVDLLRQHAPRWWRKPAARRPSELYAEAIKADPAHPAACACLNCGGQRIGAAIGQTVGNGVLLVATGQLPAVFMQPIEIGLSTGMGAAQIVIVPPGMLQKVVLPAITAHLEATK